MFEVRENGLAVMASGWGRKAWVSSKTQQNKPHTSPGMKDKLLSLFPPCSAAENRAEQRGNSSGLSWGQGPGSQGSDRGKISAETREP